MSLRLGDAQVLKSSLNPESHGVSGALQRRNNERGLHLVHTISYYTKRDCRSQGKQRHGVPAQSSRNEPATATDGVLGTMILRPRGIRRTMGRHHRREKAWRRWRS